jgi:hypothetical protein
MKPRDLSISAFPALDPTPANDVAYLAAAIHAFNLAYDAGVRGNIETYTWRDLEPSAGKHSLEDFKSFLEYSSSHDFSILVGIQVLNTTAKETPPDLKDVAFDSPQMKDRFHALLDQLIPVMTHNVLYLSIGNEIDVYLDVHNEWAAYQNFYEDAVAYLHNNAPWIKVGVTATFGGASGPTAAQVAALNEVSDIYILTYYPLNPDFTVQSPDSPLQDIPGMVQLAAGRPLIMQEVGYPASAVDHSSEEKQAQFVTNVYRVWGENSSAIPFLNFFAMHDFTAQLCKDLSAYYGINDYAPFREFLCSLGFRKANGAPKLAWQAFVDGAKSSGFSVK